MHSLNGDLGVSVNGPHSPRAPWGHLQNYMVIYLSYDGEGTKTSRDGMDLVGKAPKWAILPRRRSRKGRIINSLVESL